MAVDEMRFPLEGWKKRQALLFWWAAGARASADLQLYHTCRTFVNRQFQQNFFNLDPVFCAIFLEISIDNLIKIVYNCIINKRERK